MCLGRKLPRSSCPGGGHVLWHRRALGTRLYYVRVRAATYILTRNGRIQNGWTRPVFRHSRGQAVWINIQSGNKLKKGTVFALGNKPQSCLHGMHGWYFDRETADKLIGLTSQVVPYPESEETEPEISDPMMVQNQFVTQPQTWNPGRPGSLQGGRCSYHQLDFLFCSCFMCMN